MNKVVSACEHDQPNVLAAMILSTNLISYHADSFTSGGVDGGVGGGVGGASAGGGTCNKFKQTQAVKLSSRDCDSSRGSHYLASIHHRINDVVLVLHNVYGVPLHNSSPPPTLSIRAEYTAHGLACSQSSC